MREVMMQSVMGLGEMIWETYDGKGGLGNVG